ncbi:hypothetical protein NQ314_019196 [Rhamnusium bicolor]|uniref:Uncharacterized protein n=1 Tax=Rhamnusium bicolor TaxID=1586634 RepID=A0AAV8WP57_9CUCU|nr:hypothetical protein NQ314_019196 [Rhamnusium bicolor]
MEKVLKIVIVVAVKKMILIVNHQKRSSLKQRTSILLFGKDLDKQPIEGAIDFSSDQESTGGEEEDETVG